MPGCMEFFSPNFAKLKRNTSNELLVKYKTGITIAKHYY